MKDWLRYFRSPFPCSGGFSPYRFPGLLVHLPVTGFFLYAAILLTGDHLWLTPLILIYFIIGLYLGRDLAIISHYNILILPAVILGLIFLPMYAVQIQKLANELSAQCNGLYSLLSSLPAILFFLFHLRKKALLKQHAQESNFSS